MSTIQKQIRDLAVTKISTATSLASGSIYRAFRRDLDVSALPAILIYGQSDRPVDPDADHRFPHQRIYTVRFEIRVKDRIEDDVTDTLAGQVRKAILADDTFGGLAMRATWSLQQWDGVENEFPESGTALDFDFYYVYQPE